MSFFIGKAFVFGLEPIKPLVGFPPGRTRIRQRNSSYTVVFVRPPEGGIRKFVVEKKNGAWRPGLELEANRTAATEANS